MKTTNVLLRSFVALFFLITCTARAATVSWTGAGGDNLWHNPTNWSGGVVPTFGDDVIVNVPGSPVITIDTTGVNIRSIQCVESLRLESTTLSLSDGLSTFAGPLHLAAGWISIDGASTVVNVSGPTTWMGTSVSAHNGARLWLTNLTELRVGTSSAMVSAFGPDSLIDLSSVTNCASLSVIAYEGGKVDLRRLNKPPGQFTVTSQSPGSVVDLSGLSGTLRTPATLNAAHGGMILLPSVTALLGVTVRVTGDGEVVTGPLTRVEGCAFNAFDGARIWLTNLTSLTLSFPGLNLNVQGAGSAIYLSNLTNVVASDSNVKISIHVAGGGLVDLHRLSNPLCVIAVYVLSTGSTVDLSGIIGKFTGQANIPHSISVDGGSVLMPGVNAFERVNAFVTGQEGLVTAPLHSLVNSTLSLARATNNFSLLTNIVDSAVYASTGAKLWLTNVTTLYITNGTVSFQASGAEAAVYLPNVTNAVYWDTGYSLSVHASSGGELDLRRLPNPTGRFTVTSDYNGSTVNLSSLKGILSGNQFMLSISIGGGGAIVMPDVTGLDRAYLDLTGSVQLPIANWGSITRSAVRARNGTYTFDTLTNIFGTSVHAMFAGKIWLTNLPTLTVMDGSVSLQASGAGAGLYLPNVTNIVIGPDGVLSGALFVYANDGGDIDLRNVNSITGGGFYVNSLSPGSIVDLSALSSLTSGSTRSSLLAAAGGFIRLTDTALLVSNVGLNFESSPNSIIPAFANPGTEMVLYAQAWDAYLIEARDTRVPGSPWSPYLRVPMTNVIQTVAARPPANLAFRVTPLLAEPPALRMDRPADQQTQLTLFGLPGETYRIESKSVFDTGVLWQDGPTVTLTNAFRIFPEAASAEPSHYYRARKL